MVGNGSPDPAAAPQGSRNRTGRRRPTQTNTGWSPGRLAYGSATALEYRDFPVRNEGPHDWEPADWGGCHPSVGEVSMPPRRRIGIPTTMFLILAPVVANAAAGASRPGRVPR